MRERERDDRIGVRMYVSFKQPSVITYITHFPKHYSVQCWVSSGQQIWVCPGGLHSPPDGLGHPQPCRTLPHCIPWLSTELPAWFAENHLKWFLGLPRAPPPQNNKINGEINKVSEQQEI